MHYASVVELGWVAVPVVAYIAGRFVIARVSRVAGTRDVFKPRSRLEELRRRQASGQWVIRGRMSEALRLAEGTTRAPLAVPQASQRVAEPPVGR